MKKKSRIVVLGGGFGGAYCARRLARLGGNDAAVTVIDRHNYLLFYPLLVEAGTGSLEPRHATVPLREYLQGCEFRMGEVTEVDTARNELTYTVAGDQPEVTLSYDHLVIGLGSVSNLPPVPGLIDYAWTMKSLRDAVGLRDRMVHLLEIADATADAAERRRLLSVVVVGGNFTGVEVAGEYCEFVLEAVRHYPNIHPSEIRFTLVETSPRILGPLDDDTAAYVTETMRRRGIDFVLNNSVTAIGPDSCTLKNGETIETNTVIWCAGIAASPLVRKMGLPADKRGWLTCDDHGRVQGFSNVWSVGDCAVNLDENGKAHPPTAQSAIGEGRLVAENIVHVLRGEPTKPLFFKDKGSVTPLGGHNAVVNVGKHRFSGIFAWVVYRIFYLVRIPGFKRKIRVALDWFGALLTKRDVVQISIHKKRPTPRPDRLADGKPTEAGSAAAIKSS